MKRMSRQEMKLKKELLDTTIDKGIDGGPDCVPWPGATFESGYGQARRWRVEPGAKNSTGAHRLVWELAGYILPNDSEYLRHLCPGHETCGEQNPCRHRLCVNVDHLEVAPRPQSERSQLPYPCRKCGSMFPDHRCAMAA